MRAYVWRLKHRIWPLGIRLKLTLVYSAIFAILLALVGTAFYVAFQQSLLGNVDTTLQLRAEQIAAGISFENGAITIHDVTGSLPGLATVSTEGQQATTTPIKPTPEPVEDEDLLQPEVKFGSLVRVLDANGRTVYVSPGFRSLAVPTTSFTQALHGDSWLGSLRASDGEVVRLSSQPLSDNGAVFGVLQIGGPLEETTATLRSAAIGLFLLAPFALALAALASYWLAARAFRPVVSLTRMAREIGMEDLHRRVPAPKAKDEIRELALTLNDMIARLEHAFVQQRRFVADASHELRTPVAAIRTLAETALLDGMTRANQVDALHRVTAEAERLGQLITDLLTLARGDEGHTMLEIGPVRLDELAEAAVAVAAPLALQRDVELAVSAPAPVTVAGDEPRLIQVVLNLLDNAIEHTSPGDVIMVQVDAEEPWARLVVRDTGCGVAAEHIPHVFERFYRVDRARPSNRRHTGLGLSIVDWIVQAHQGSAVMESQVGEGTTVSVRIPLVDPHDTKNHGDDRTGTADVAEAQGVALDTRGSIQ